MSHTQLHARARRPHGILHSFLFLKAGQSVFLQDTMMKFSFKLPVLSLLEDLCELFKTVHEFTWIPRETNGLSHVCVISKCT